MPVTIENIGPCRKKLRIEVDAQQVAGTRAEVLREIRKVASIPGFRPGKAPEPFVEKRFGDEILKELKSRLIPEAYRKAVNDLDIHVVGYPEIKAEEYVPGQPYTFTAEVDTAPEFALPEYKGIELTRKEAPVSDDDVEKVVESLRDQRAEFVDVTGRALAMDDYAVISFRGTVDGKPITELVPESKLFGEYKDFWLLMKSDSFLPGFCDQLTGAQLGEKRQVNVEIPADFPAAKIAGAKAVYEVEVTGIKQKKLADLDDAFAKQFNQETMEKLRQAIRDDIKAERTQQADNDMRRQAVDLMLAKAEFELPESLVNNETRNIVYDLVRDNTSRGIAREQIEQKKDEIYSYAAKNAQERLRASFVLEAIARQEKIEVTEQEINERIAQMAVRYRLTPQKMREQLAEREALGNVEEQLLVSKTLDYIVANAKVQRQTA